MGEPRKCKNILKSYLNYTSQSESPTRYHIWCFLGIVAAALRRKTWIDMGFFKVYSNMFIVLVGPPGARKTIAIRIATSLVSDNSNVHISADCTTREALIKAMKDAQETMSLGENETKIGFHSSLTIVSEELSVFLGKDNHALLSFLTNLYDCSDRWEYRTKNMGTDILHGTWLNMLAATTPAWLCGSIPLTAIGGGFTSRIIFIVEDGPRHKKSIPSITEEEMRIREDIIFDLEQIALLQGEVKLSMGDSGAPIEEHKVTQGVHKGNVSGCAYCWFDDWYINKTDKLESDSRFSGYSSRKHVHMLKVAMLLSICEGDGLVVDKSHLELALGLIDELEDKMVDAFGAVGRSDVALDVDDILNTIKVAKKIPRKDLVRGLWRDVSPLKFDQAVRQLIEMKYIHQYISPDNNIIYEWLGKEEESNEDKV